MHVLLQSTVAVIKKIIISYGMYNRKIYAVFFILQS